MYAAGELPDATARTIAYLFEKLLAYWRIEKELDIETELQEIRERLEKAEK
jgi:hypothetical protein